MTSQMRRLFEFVFLFINVISARILKLPECNKYDAEFSKINYDQRLAGDILALLEFLTLRRCLTKCMFHPSCQSANFMRQNGSCELLGNSVQRNLTRNALFVPANGWNHFETSYDKKKLGPWCSSGNNNPCNTITERCEDRCGGNHQCIAIGEQLHSFIQEATQSSSHTSNNYPATLAFDGLENTFSLSNSWQFAPHWIKAKFKQRLFIEYIIVVSRHDLVGTENAVRNDYIDFFSILYIGEQSIQTHFGNTGQILGDRKTISCQKFADELYANQPIPQGPFGYMSIAEIWIYGETAV